MEILRDGQAPDAIILTCSDSRVPPELIFDKGLGDLFVIRVAGNVTGPGVIGTIEYGVDHLKIPLLVVLGHTDCGAVTAVVNGMEADGHLRTLAERIAPAVQTTRDAYPESGREELISRAVRENLWLQIENLFRDSPTVSRAAAEGRLQVWGAVYDLDSGAVDWLGRRPRE
jgi:carbonic anhydrase